MMLFYLATDPADCADVLGLPAHPASGAWPLVTAAEFHRFIATRAAHEPTGQWWPSGVSLEGDRLIYRTPQMGEDGAQVFTAVGTNDYGAALYAIDTWQWVKA